MASEISGETTAPSENHALNAQDSNTSVQSAVQNREDTRATSKKQVAFASIKTVTQKTTAGVEQRTTPLHASTSKNDGLAPEPSPYSLQETRGSIILSKTTGLKQSGPYVAEFHESILDAIRRCFSRARPQHIKSDSFEAFVRQKGEITLANVYHQLCDKSALPWQRLFSCRILDTTYLDADVPDFFQPDDCSGSISDLFARTSQRLQSCKSSTDTTALCSIIMNESDAQKVFSLIDLFAASAFPSPMFFALLFCAYLLRWSECLSDTDKIVKSSLISEEQPMVLDNFDLPSESVPMMDSFGNGSYEYTFIWAYEPPNFNFIKYTARIPYKHEPVLEKIQMVAQRDGCGSWCITLLFRNRRIFEDFESTLEAVYDQFRVTIENSDSTSQKAQLHVYIVFLTIYKQINMELSAFLKLINTQARNMTIEAREHPGRSKLLHTFVLVDHTLLAKHHLKASQERLSSLDLTGCPPAVQELKKSIQNDIKFLLTALQKTSRRLKESQSHIRTFSEVKAAQTAGIMAVLVAIYVPLAGVAGYLGMNTIGIVNGDIDTNVFWKVAIPLTVGTILLPLSATVIARVTVAASFSTRIFTRRNWPAVMDTCIASTVAAIIIAHFINWLIGPDRYFTRVFKPISLYESAFTNAVLAVLEVFKMLEHIFIRNERAKKWLMLFGSNFLVCIACMVVGIVIPGEIVTLVLPIFWIILVSAVVRPALGALGVM